ncbi:MAG: phosphomethylpyrimidine synthase ThiC [Methanothrix sp.]|nr:phosphomethylpyrimidine synthase ThiC [Methanothrix sp.]
MTWRRAAGTSPGRLGNGLLTAARSGRSHPAIEEVAKAEGLRPSFLRRQIALGRVVVMQRESQQSLGIGEGLKTKINANIGSSSAASDPISEVEKARIAERYGADTITDLSMGGPIDDIRKRIMGATRAPLTTVPIYQAVAESRSFGSLTEADMLRMIQRHVDDGVSSVVIHAGLTLEMLEGLRDRRRIMGMVSKGGSFVSAWMIQNGRENPLLSHFERICRILASRDVVLSLGNSMRSGCVHDCMDGPQISEVEMNAALARRANDLGVQVIIEGMGGHVSPGRIRDYVAVYKRVADRRPLFVAGPLPVETGVGHDHISGCVGGALAAGYGADYLCYITPAEHLALPDAEQVREGVVAFKIAAHIGDSIKYGPRQEDRDLAICRIARDWEGQFRLAIDGERARQIHRRDDLGSCTMCGRYCAMIIMERYLRLLS